MVRFLRILLCKRSGKLVIAVASCILLVLFFVNDNLKGELEPPKQVSASDFQVTFENLIKRLDNLEEKVSQLQVQQITLREHSPAPLSKNNEVIDQAVLAHSKKCKIPSNWRYPFCSEKVLWMRMMWTSNLNCYVKQHKVNPIDDCSLMRFLSEVESWCPVLPGREKSNPLQSRPRAKIRTDITGLIDLLKSSLYAFIRDRITRFWPHWVEGAKKLQKEKPNFENRAAQNLLVFMGSFALEPLFFTFAYQGGPLGELVQWSDLIASLYILGHNLTISASEKDLPKLLNIPNIKGCASERKDDEFDTIYTDYNGLRYMAMVLGPNHSQYRCKVRVIDSFGTEAEFNFVEYSHPIQGGRSPWANADLNLRQIMTMFPHSPDNTFLGFVVDGPPQSHNSSQTTINKVNTNKTKPIGMVYGKEPRFWKDKKSYLDTLHEYFELHATLGQVGAVNVTDNIPDYIINHGILKGGELKELLKKTKVFIGLGFPYEGPAPLEAIASGCVFLNPKHDPPHNRLNTFFFKAKPTFRALTSQHPYTETFIGEPHVYTVDITDIATVRTIAKKILETEVKPYLPFEWTPHGMLERVNTFSENLDFCSTNSVIWPPEDQHKLIKAKKGVSCEKACMEKGLLCESFHFHIINDKESFSKLGIMCRLFKDEVILDAPSLSSKDNVCSLQAHPLAFSCVASHPDKIRLCPCRDFQPQQVALCQTCS